MRSYVSEGRAASGSGGLGSDSLGDKSEAGSGVASSEAVKVIWAVEEDREAASAIRDSASLSEMRVSEKMTSYWVWSANVEGTRASTAPSPVDRQADRHRR